MCQFITLFHARIGTFPLCAGIGLFCIAAIVYLQLSFRKVDLDTENKIMIGVPFSVLFGFLAAYSSDVLFRGGLKAFLSPFGYGVTFYGWLSGGVFFLILYSKMVRIDLMFLLNCFLPTYSIAQAFGRIGCFLGGCCFGRPAKFGVIYPHGSLPYQTFGATPLFPVQLLESLYLFILFAVLFAFIKFRKRAAFYLILMPAGRFVFEFFRGDNRGSLFHQNCLSPAQICSLFFLGTGFCLLVKSRKENHPADNTEKTGSQSPTTAHHE